MYSKSEYHLSLAFVPKMITSNSLPNFFLRNFGVGLVISAALVKSLCLLNLDTSNSWICT